MSDKKVLIVGGGPVGMTSALELARYGVPSILVERNPETTRHPKMDLTNGRSMELFHRLGIVEDIRAAGVHGDNPFDISWVTHLDGYELHRFAYPSANEVKQRIREHNDGSEASQQPLRVSQIAIEPVLKGKVDANPLVDVRFGVKFEQITQEFEDGLVAELSDSATGEKTTVECSYLLGCDGGGSRVRRTLGVELEGEENVASAYMVHFHSTDTQLLQRFGVTWHYQNGAGTLIAQNDVDAWTLQAWLPPGDDGSTWDADETLQSWIGCDFEYEILQANPWSAHFVVAEKYNHGRVLLAGDAAHQYIPTGGYGMNSGIADACAVAWVVAARVQGWGGDNLFEAYDAERRNTAWWHLNASKRHMGVRIEMSELYANAGDVDSDTPEAEANRTKLGEQIKALGNAENESWGVELGYRYDSGIIFNEANAPEIDPLTYTPSTWPGSRLPHVFLNDGESIHDKLGKYFTLVCFSGQEGVISYKGTVPLEQLNIEQGDIAEIYQYKYILVRPDQHIAWRGNTLPDDLEALVAKAAGH